MTEEELIDRAIKAYTKKNPDGPQPNVGASSATGGGFGGIRRVTLENVNGTLAIYNYHERSNRMLRWF